MTSSQQLFDHRRVKVHKARAAADFAQHNFLWKEAQSRLDERLSEINRTFENRLDISDTLPAEHDILSLSENTYNLITAIGGLHWVNDLPGVLIQIQRALKPDGLFIGMLPGGQTLRELRESFEKAEIELRGGISPRISPFVDVRDGGALLQRVGFVMPVSDNDTLNVTYEHPLKLLRDLRGMGETNALLESAKHFTPCSLIMSMCDHYLREFSDDAGRIPATFELITLTGWKAA